MPGQLTVASLFSPSSLAPLKSPDLFQALSLSWGGDLDGALGSVTTLLAENPEHPCRFAAYRLWISLLAEQGERAALKDLAQHLFRRGQESADDQVTFAALRGVAHFELDEISAARLLARSMAGYVDNPYCLELIQFVDSRFNEKVVPALATAKVPLNDYCHWQTLCRDLLRGRHEQALNQVLAFVRDHVRSAPLPHVFEFHGCIDSGFYAAAALVAERLVELYPDNLDYRYYQAYALFEDGDYPSSRRLLMDSLALGGERDSEVLGLLGHCHAKLGNPEQAAGYLRRAIAILKDEGLPTSHMSLELANVEEELRGDKLDPVVHMPRMARNWLVHLSPRRYHELQQSSESTIDHLVRPMGSEPRPGDYCFFASAAAANGDGSDQWRIVAIYAVDSDPIWHPTQKWHTSLKLVKRLPFGIPVDVQEQDERQVPVDLPQGHPLRFGVFELDSGALDIIEEAARLHRDDLIERRQSGSQSRRPTA